MTDFKQLVLKKCRKCETIWYTEPKSVTLNDQDRIDLITMTVSYCKLCRGEWEKEQNFIPPYDRGPFQKGRR